MRAVQRCGPAVAARVRTEDAVLRDFGPGDAVLAAPRLDAEVARVGQRVAGFLVAPEPRDAVFGV